MTDNSKYFIDFVKKECRKYKVKCVLKKTKYIKIRKDMLVSGYFDEEVPELVCSMLREDSIGILAHEYCHLTQWVENIPIWKKAGVSIPIINDWLQGEKVKNIRKHLAVCRDLELDNEKRAVKIIKQFELPIDIDNYIRKANAYVLSYNYIYSTRRWFKPKNSPYSNQTLINSMSNKFNMNYNKLSKRVEKIFISENI